VRRITLLLALVCLALGLVACDASLGEARDLARRLGGSVALPAEPAAPAPTITPVPSPEPTVDISSCQPSLAYVDDITIPDGMQIAAGEAFTKTWSVLNAGTCPWGPGFVLGYVDGEPMGLGEAVPLPAAEPGQTVIVSVPMRASAALGIHRSNWRLSIDGTFYGTTLFVIIEATQPVASPTPIASPTPTSAPTPVAEALPTATAPAPTQATAPASSATSLPSEGLRAVILYDDQGLWVTNVGSVDWHTLYVELNPGLLRRGYTAQLDLLPAGERAFWPPSALRKPDGTAWPAEEAPWAVYLRADEGDYYAEPSAPSMAAPSEARE